MTDSVAALTERGRAELLLYQLMGERSLLDRAIEHFMAAADAAAGGVAAPVTLANLAGALLLRLEIEGRRDDLTGAVGAAQGAVDAMDPDDPALAAASTNLAAALLARHERGGPATDLDRAVAAAADAQTDVARPGRDLVRSRDDAADPLRARRRPRRRRGRGGCRDRSRRGHPDR